MTFVDFVIQVHRTLSEAGVAHAFGGALALAQVAEPRGTVDVDVNVFTPVDEVDAVLGALAQIQLHPEEAKERWVPIAGIRLRSAHRPYPVDLFLARRTLRRDGEAHRRAPVRPGPHPVTIPVG